MTSSSARRLMLWAGVLAGVTISAVATLSIASERRAPKLAMALAYNTGIAKASFGQSYLEAGKAGDLTGGLSVRSGHADALRSLSLAAYRQEPLNPIALRNLGLAEAARDRNVEAETAMRLSQRMSRRDQATSLWLMGLAAKRDDFQTLLILFDNMLRTSLSARQMLMAPMVKLLADPRMVAGVIPLLDRAPDWETAFWNESYRHSEGLRGAAEVRMRRSPKDFTPFPQADRRLVAALAAEGAYETADRLVSTLEPSRPRSSELLRNADFTHTPDFDPFDWQVLENSNASTIIDRSAGVMSIQTFGNAGPITRQLVALPAGSLQLTAVRSPWREGNPILELSLACAEQKTSALAHYRLESTTTVVRFERPMANCTYYWLQLAARDDATRGENAVEIERISITSGR